MNTANPLDLAIEGDGFFQVTLPNGELMYTRDGALRLNSLGNLVTAQGYLLSPVITLPPDSISTSVGIDGTVSCQTAGANTSTIVGQFSLVKFLNPCWLQSEPGHLFRETTEAGAPVSATPGQGGTGLIQQGFLEHRTDQLVYRLIELARKLSEEQTGDSTEVRVRIAK